MVPSAAPRRACVGVALRTVGVVDAGRETGAQRGVGEEEEAGWAGIAELL